MTIGDIRKLARQYSVDVVVEEYLHYRLVFWVSGDKRKVQDFLMTVEMEYLTIGVKGYFFRIGKGLLGKVSRCRLKKKFELKSEQCFRTHIISKEELA